MKTIEIRRHSIRNRAFPDLSAEGIALAARIGREQGRFDRVVTSNVPRAIQTAQAMGHTVDETVELLASMGDSADMECPWPASFAEYAAAASQKGPTARYTRRLSEFYAQLVEALPEDGAALVINHGGVVELSAIACLPDADYTTFGRHVECCEGVRVFFENGKFTRIEILRV